MNTAKIPQIEAYDGSYERLPEIGAHFTLKFIVESTTYSTDQLKVAYALSICQGGAAGSWAASQAATYATGQFPSRNTFLLTFKKQFSLADATTTALAKMKALKMTGTAQEYNAEFRRHQTATKNTSVPLFLGEYLAGLKAPLRDKVMGVDPDSLDTWEKVFRCAERFDEHWRANMGASRSSNEGYKKNRFRNKKTRAIGTNDETINRLSDAERSKLMKEGKCFRCRQTGHMARNCPKFPNNRPIRSTDTASVDSQSDSDSAPTASASKSQAIAILKQLSPEDRAEVFDEEQIFD